MYRIEFYKRLEISITIFKLKYRRPYAMPNVSYFGRNNPLAAKRSLYSLQACAHMPTTFVSLHKNPRGEGWREKPYFRKK